MVVLKKSGDYMKFLAKINSYFVAQYPEGKRVLIELEIPNDSVNESLFMVKMVEQYAEFEVTPISKMQNINE